jgi:hypothetical protein
MLIGLHNAIFGFLPRSIFLALFCPHAPKRSSAASFSPKNRC